MDERKLAKRLAGSDTEALEIIITKYTGYVCTVAFNFSGGALSECEIDEVAAEVFGKLWKSRENINWNIGLRAYLSAAARNAVKDRFKAKPPPAEDISQFEIPSDFSVEKTAELSDMMLCIYDALKKIGKDDREVFIRYYFYGEKSSRIAAAKGISKGAVDVKLHRVRSRIKSYLNERGYYYV